MSYKEIQVVLVCDFCGRNQNEVATLLTGLNDVAICDACVYSAVTTLNEMPYTPPPSPNSQDEPT
jgi:ATP-dependent protease Clp ATPase subunit